MFAGRFAGAGRSARSLPGRPVSRRRPRGRPARPICCWTGWPSWSPRDAPRPHPCCDGQRGSLPTKRSPRRSAGDGARRLWSPRSWCGTRTAGVRFRPASSSPAAQAGLLAQLLTWADASALLTTWRGDFAAAASLVAEAEAIAAATGHPRPYRGLCCSPDSGGRSRGRPADRGDDHGGPGGGTGGRGPVCAVGVRHPLQRARPLRPSTGRRARRRAGTRDAGRHVGAARADRGGQQDRADPAGRRRARPAGRGDQHRPDRLGAGDLRALPRAAQRRRGRRALVSRGGRPARPHRLSA